MKLRFIGSGSAFATIPGNFQSNMIFEVPDPQTGEIRRLLFDCGSDVRWSLDAIGLTYADIDALYVSHLHADHVGGIEWLGFKNYFLANERRIPLFVPEPIRGPLWDNTLKGGMELLDFGQADLDTFFEVEEIETDESFVWMGVTFHLVPLVHLRGGGYVMWSYGVFVETDKGGSLLTSDTRFEIDRLQPWYDKSTHLIFHDCETCVVGSRAHSHYDDLLSLPDDLRKRMWLYHISYADTPDAVGAGFKGVVAPGQSFDLGEPV